MIVIVGAGPVGAHAAYLLAKDRKDVTLVEEHSSIGKPVHCTGIVTSSIKDTLDVPKSSVINRIKSAKIVGPDKSSLTISFREENLILDREIFDKELVKRAERRGAKVLKSTSFSGYKDNKSILVQKHHSKKLIIKSDFLIGADGANSKVRRILNPSRKVRFWTGIQARVRYRNENFVEFFPYIGTYAWIVPESPEIARVGICAGKDTSKIFNSFLGQNKIKKADIIELQGGVIPRYDPVLNTHQNNVYLIGDAATQVKATTGGGLVPGLKAAAFCNHAIQYGSNYEKLWKRNIGNELSMHLLIRKVLDQFSYKDYSDLISIMSKEKNSRILEQIDRDNPKSIALRLLLSEPSLISYAKYLFH